MQNSQMLHRMISSLGGVRYVVYLTSHIVESMQVLLNTMSVEHRVSILMLKNP